MSSLRIRRPGAFTLIELLVVVAIIALLISILLPSLSQARAVARMVKCQAILKQVGTAHHLYANEAEDWFVPHRVTGSTYSRSWLANIKFRTLLGIGQHGSGTPVWPYAWPDGLICPNVPSDRRHVVYLNYGGNGTRDTSNPSHAPRTDNGKPVNAGDFEPNSSATTTGTSPGLIRIFRSKVRNPSSKVQTVDANNWETSVHLANSRVYWDIFGEADGSTNPWGGGRYFMTSYRHNEGANLLMFDGHVEHRGKDQVYYYTASGATNWTPTQDLWLVYK